MLVPFKNLLLPALAVLLFGTFVMKRFLGTNMWVSAVVSFIKALVPTLYFAFFSRAQWNLVDDLNYFDKALLLLQKGNNPLIVFFTPDGLTQLLDAAEGTNVIYYWWNMVAVDLFGPFYSSPILLNVALTFVSAVLLARLVRISGYSESYARWLGVFFLLHWEIITWSSFVNLKDTIVVMLTLAAVNSALVFIQRRSFRYLLLLVAITWAFYYIRFYVPVLLGMAVVIWALVAVKGWGKVPLIVVATLGAVLATPQGSSTLFLELANGDWIFGPMKMMLTPQPWAVEGGYSFLMVPSILHWVMFIPALIIGADMFARNKVFRFCAIYFLVLIFFYGFLIVMRGPRQRLQVEWVVIWAQFEFLLVRVSDALRGNVRLQARAA